MYIFEEHEEDPISQENVSHMRTHVNKLKNNENFEKKRKKEKKKENEKENEKNKSGNIEIKKQQNTSNPHHMIYNVVDDLSKLSITFTFTEVVKITQQKENIFKFLDEPSRRMEAIVTNLKQNKNTSAIKLRGKVPPFYISLKIMMLLFTIVCWVLEQ
jgi:phenylalanyl-tRNA synthetase alpha subunit